MRIVFVLIALTLVSSSLAFDCNRIPQYNDCVYLNASNLSNDEKAEAILNLVYPDGSLANHTLIQVWNDGINVTPPPDGVVLRDSIYIRNAWTKLLTINPSFYWNQTLFVPRSAVIRTAYNFGAQLPQNYQSSHYPDTDHGDCRRTYSMASSQGILTVFAGGRLLGQGARFLANFSQNTTLDATYDIQAGVSISHSRWRQQCCQWAHGECVGWCWRCLHDHDEQQNDRVVLHDYWNVSFYDQPESVNFHIIERRGNCTIAKLLSQGVNLQFSSEGSKLTTSTRHYSVRYWNPPYYFLTLQSEEINDSSQWNILWDTDKMLYYGQGCQVSYNGPFNASSFTCNQGYEESNLSIKTDKTSYKPNDTIIVSLLPSDQMLNVTYANESVQATGSAQFIAQPYKNLITVQKGEISRDAFVHVKTNETLGLVILLSTFSGVSYIFYILIRKYWGWWI